jgi:hypothetical protein
MRYFHCSQSFWISEPISHGASGGVLRIGGAAASEDAIALLVAMDDHLSCADPVALGHGGHTVCIDARGG